MPTSLRTRCVVSVVTVLAAVAIWPAAAAAGWTNATSGWAGARTPTLAAPTGLTASCAGTGLLSHKVKLQWAATPSAWADGYEIAWGTTAGGPYPGVRRVSPAELSWVSESLNYPLIGSTRYYFVVRAASGTHWRSPNSNQGTKSISVLGCG